MQVVNTNGAQIPAIGLGTSQMVGEVCARVVLDALAVGYRHIDTAQGYGNELAVGEAVANSSVPRDEIFITTKIAPQSIGERDLQTSLEQSLRKLRVDRVDLALIHWPNPKVPVAEAVRAICEAKRRGLTRHIGISNFTIAKLKEALSTATEPMVTEQLEYHPFIDQSKILTALRRHKLAITAYCPIALGRVVGEPVIEAIGKAHSKTAAQVALRWLVQQGDVIAIPKSSRVERLRENLAIFDFTLGAEEMRRIAGLSARKLRLINEPEWVPSWD